MRLVKYLLILSIVAVAALASGGSWVAAQGPVADFPSRIAFNPDESPEGVAVDKVGNVYVSVLIGSDPDFQYDEIWKFTPTGEKSVLVQFPSAGRVGLAVDAIGNVYLARVGPDAGVYVVDRDGDAVLLPGTEQINYADGLALDQRGNLYITDLVSLDSQGCTGVYGPGGIYRFPKGGTEAELWLRHELLTGYCVGLLGYPAGANGIQFYSGDLYVINTDKGNIVRIPVRPDGSPGEPTVWATLKPVPDSPLPFPVMADGFAFDVHGNAYVAVVSIGAIVRIHANDTERQDTIAVYPFSPLDTPTSIAFGTGKGGRTSIFVTNMGWMSTFGVPYAPGTSLMKIDVGIPGLPLP